MVIPDVGGPSTKAMVIPDVDGPSTKAIVIPDVGNLPQELLQFLMSVDLPQNV